MSIAIAESVRNARLQAIADAIDSAATAGKILLYSGTRPGAGLTPSGVLQATVVFDDPCATVTAAVLTFTPDVEGQRVASDTITWGRLVNGDGVFVMDGDVTVAGGGGDFTLNNVNGFAGAFIKLNSFVMGE